LYIIRYNVLVNTCYPTCTLPVVYACNIATIFIINLLRLILLWV